MATVSHKKSGPNRSTLRQPETKHYSLGQDLTALDTAPSSGSPALYHILTLNNIGSGDGQSERSGLKIQNRKLELRVKVAVDPNSDASNTNIVADAHLFRVVVYLDRIPSGSAPNWDVLMDNQPANEGQEYDFPTVYFKNRFRLLADRFVTVGKSYVVYDGSNYHAYGNFKFLELQIPLTHDTWYSDGTSNLAAIQEGNIGMFICADASSTSYSKMKFSWRSRLLYNDY